MQSPKKWPMSQLLRKIVIFILCTLRNCVRNAALISRNIPCMRHITGQTVFGTDYMRSTQCPQACSKTCPKSPSQASEVAISKAAHLAASKKLENRSLNRLRKRRNAPVNHQQLVQVLQEEWFTIPMPIFHI